MEVHTFDYHTAGEPLRIVTAGLPEVRGDTMLARRRYMKLNLDHFRRMLILEPRGHAEMYGAVLTPPVSPDGDVGVLFLHNEGYSTMCGHGIIALVTAGLEHGLFDIADEQAIRIDTPAGQVTAHAEREVSGRVSEVSFLNVPSFVVKEDLQLSIGGRAVSCTVAFGGAFYAYLDAGPFGFDLVPGEATRLIGLGRQVKRLVASMDIARHPQGGGELDSIYGAIFVAGGGKPRFSRNVCIFADGQLDRSPTGTGVSGRAAIHFRRGDIGLGEWLEIESIIGSRFRVRCVRETRVGGTPAVIPEVTGSAHMTGEHRFVFDERDPLGAGFLVR